LIFPYLEKRGITAVPRVLWNKEDQVIIKLRELSMLVEKGLSSLGEYAKSVAEKAREISKEISDLVFREERILFPSVWALLSEGEWAAIHDDAKRIGYLVPADIEWTPKAKPLLPHEISGVITPEQIEKLPQEFKFATLTPDMYEVRSEGDLEFETGFLSKDEVEAIFKHLPLEITYADVNDRVAFFSESMLRKGFARTKTLISRRIEYCHPPRLENFVKSVVNDLKAGKADFKEYWTRLGDRIIRVMVVAVKDRNGNYLGTLEMVEDLTEIVNNPEEIKKKIIVL
ncbi:MAG: PAS domain-containing protein, partial [Candidatus Bathyarchaeia archaeon]